MLLHQMRTPPDSLRPPCPPAGRTSSHTFILYLTGCQQGGSTVLLDQMRTPSAGAAGIRASIMPVRGRLLLFPHMCPHLAQPVLAEGLPKLLLRGEMF
jgi:hypothetical protein